MLFLAVPVATFLPLAAGISAVGEHHKTLGFGLSNCCDEAMLDWRILLNAAVTQGASDLFLSSGNPPTMRLHGKLQRLIGPDVLSADQVNDTLDCLLSTDQRNDFNDSLDLDVALEHEQIGRFRVNVYQHHLGPGIVFRVIPLEPPKLDQLIGHDPLALSILGSLVGQSAGLALFVGSTGSGKSSTQAAVVDMLNRNGERHIICVEDPIEFVHTSAEGLIHQRQVGLHVDSFDQALRAALRENPDVIVLGELRDATTIQLALEAAETGHLVLATCHAPSAVHSVTRVLEGIPQGQRAQARSVLAASLLVVVYQQLLPGLVDRRVAACELLIATPAVRNLIREDKPTQLHSTMQTGREHGMRTIKQSIQELVNAGAVAEQAHAEP
ncbi:MAG: PilT/PilU family type 4a pilus ATPase [Proteobacteria bacterium]|nr:PilT/PilU family type 4a pilus ATPase [Pseudomonadota bacterium]